ncbi:phage pre-tape measure protein [Neoaquamicrobium sediminum]|uniref:phage pre-tape measure protein n=1 Tax=Neoaquamicrobium sediminum TaxID=1849104 RepID=UPI00361B0F30
MALKGYRLPTLDVELPGGDSFPVRGLSLPDITFLVSRHGDTMRTLFDRYSGDETIAISDLASVGTSILETAPTLAAEIVAVAADEPDEMETIMRLPFPVQVDALEKVGKLTFDTAGGPKKVVETVIRVFRGISDMTADLRTSKAGSLVSGGK